MTYQLLLHIGRPKAGSTALQHCLWTNRIEMRRQGIIYPQTAMHNKGSHKLALIFQPDLPDARAVKNMRAERIYDAMFSEARRHNARRIIASSENLFLVDPRDVRRHLPASCDIKIICYVRRQDDVLVSSYIQELKTSTIDFDTDIRSYARAPERLAWLDYASVLERWAEHFGTENIIVRVYEKEQLGGTIQEDFLQLADIDRSRMNIANYRVNPSPARDVLDVVRMINAAPELESAHKHALREPLLLASERLGQNGAFNTQLLVPSKVRREVLRRFSESNKAVARKFLGRKDGVLFKNSDMPKVCRADSYVGLELERFAQMTTSLLCTQQQQILQLTRQVRELQKTLESREA